MEVGVGVLSARREEARGWVKEDCRYKIKIIQQFCISIYFFINIVNLFIKSIIQQPKHIFCYDKQRV
jgi:hypothetical protein